MILVSIDATPETPIAMPPDEPTPLSTTDRPRATRTSPGVERAAGPPAAAVGAMRRVRSSELLGPRGELVIEHGGREYRLRITRHDRLILTA